MIETMVFTIIAGLLTVIPADKHRKFFAEKGILFSHIFFTIVLTRCLAIGLALAFAGVYLAKLFFTVTTLAGIWLGVALFVVGLFLGYRLPVAKFGDPSKVTYKDLKEQHTPRKRMFKKRK
jgi:predicted membrane protein